MSWIKIQAGLISNKKTARLAGQMKWKKLEAVGFLVSFWIWAIENCEDGQLKDITDAEIAFAVGLENAEGILKALKTAGLVDYPPARIHDWPEHQVDFLRARYRKNPEKHQKIIDQYRSSTGIGTVQAPIDRKEGIIDKQIKKEKLQPTATPFVLPDWVDLKTWQAYLEIRKAKKAAPTEHALHLIVLALGKLKDQGHDPKLVLEASIMAGWPGVYPLKIDFKKSNTGGCPPIPGKYEGIGEKA